MRLLLAGLGGWGKAWTRMMSGVQGVELVAVADPSAEAREWASSELGLPPAACHETVHSALEHTECEAVIVATPMWTHYEAVIASLDAGKHVLCEKPLATSLSDAVSMAHASTRADRVLMVGQSYRFRRPARAAQRVVASGALGELQSVRISTRRDTGKFWQPDDFRYTIPHFWLLDNGVHHFDLLRAVTGRNVRQAYCRARHLPGSAYRHDAAGVAVMELDGGATVVYDNEYATRSPETSWNGEWELTGEAGRLLWRGGNPDANTADLTLELWGQRPHSVELPEQPIDPSAAVLEAFLAAIRTGISPETGVGDNLDTMAAVFGCIRSIESGTTTDIPDLLANAVREAAYPA